MAVITSHMSGKLSNVRTVTNFTWYQLFLLHFLKCPTWSMKALYIALIHAVGTCYNLFRFMLQQKFTNTFFRAEVLTALSVRDEDQLDRYRGHTNNANITTDRCRGDTNNANITTDRCRGDTNNANITTDRCRVTQITRILRQMSGCHKKHEY